MSYILPEQMSGSTYEDFKPYMATTEEKEMVNEDDDSTGYDHDAENQLWEDNCAGYEERMWRED